LVVNGIFAANELHKSERVLSPNHQIGRPFIAVFEHYHAVAGDRVFARVHDVAVLPTIVAKHVFFLKRMLLMLMLLLLLLMLLLMLMLLLLLMLLLMLMLLLLQK
jgi:hypothetical protein